MLNHRRWSALDGADLGWLKAKHHFAVSAAGNPAHGPLGSLIVWNDDEIAATSGFPLHGHKDIEIITYVRQGVVVHQDSLGSIGRIEAGEVQVAYLVVAAGSVTVNGEPVGSLDGVVITKESSIVIVATEDAELVMVDAG